MRVIRCLCLALTVAAFIPTGPASPLQAADAAPEGQPVALLDVSYLFEKSPHFKKLMQEVTDDAQKAQEEVKRQEEAIKALAKELEGKTGASDRVQLEERITAMRGELAVKIEVQRRQFQLRQAGIYLDLYTEIQEETQQVARARGLRMVLRFNGDPVDKNNPQSVLTYINRPFVWYDAENDITLIVLKRLNDRPRGDKPADKDWNKKTEQPPK